MNKHMTFARFDAILEELGFRKTVIPGSHVNYYHDKTDTLQMIRLHEPDDLVPAYVLAATRLQMDGLGILDAKDFDEVFRLAAA